MVAEKIGKPICYRLRQHASMKLIKRVKIYNKLFSTSSKRLDRQSQIIRFDMIVFFSRYCDWDCWKPDVEGNTWRCISAHLSDCGVLRALKVERSEKAATSMAKKYRKERERKRSQKEWVRNKWEERKKESGYNDAHVHDEGAWSDTPPPGA